MFGSSYLRKGHSSHKSRAAHSHQCVQCLCVSQQRYNNRLFMAPHLVRARRTYKDVRIRSFYRTHTYIQTRARARAHTHTHTRTHARTQARTHARAHTHTHTHARTHTHTYNTHTRTHARTHARAHTHTHTHTETLLMMVW